MHRSHPVPGIALLLTVVLLVGSCGGSSGSKAEFCGKAGDLKDLGSSLSKATNLSQIKSAFAKLQAKIDDADSAAPSDVKKDVDIIKKAFGTVNTDVQKVKSEQELSTLSSKFSALTDDKNTKAASDRVTTYTKKNCNIDLSS